MSLELAEALGIALDHGCSLAELEATLLARAAADDEIAGAWLYAWAYRAIRPPRDDLAARITNRVVRDRAPQPGVIFAAAIDRPVMRPPTLLRRAPGSRRRASNPGQIATVQIVCGARQSDGCAGLDRNTNRQEVPRERL